MQHTLERVRAGEADPHCLRCGGILKSDTISFGQALVPEVIERAMRAAREADLMLAIGSTLQVWPVAGTVEVASDAGARVVILNDQPTPLDALADALLRGPIGQWLPALCGLADDA
jgi:NAD-dependent deacetylase